MVLYLYAIESNSLGYSSLKINGKSVIGHSNDSLVKSYLSLKDLRFSLKNPLDSGVKLSGALGFEVFSTLGSS